MNARLMGAVFGAAILAGLSLSTTANADSMAAGMSFGARAPDTQRMHFNVFLPLRNTDKLNALLAAQQDPKSTQYHKWLTPAQFGAQFGPSMTDMSRAAAFLRAQGFSVQTHTRSLFATGTASQVTRSFGTNLVSATTHDGFKSIVSTKAPVIPNELAAVGAVLTGFAPISANFYHHKVPLNRYSTTGGYWFDDLKQAYGYPANNATFDGKPLNGTGATIAVVETSDVLDADTKAMFDHEHWSAITGKSDPTLFGRVYVNGAVPGAFDPNSSGSVEASLDVQQAIGGAPGAHVVLYDIPSLFDSDILAADQQIVEDDSVQVVSSSFGGCELQYFPFLNGGHDARFILQIFHEVFLQGNAEGITFLAATGDFGFSALCPQPGYFSGANGKFIPGISSPSNDPNVTAVGGTNLVTTSAPPSTHSAYVRENTYGDPLIPFDPFGFGGLISGGYWGAGGGLSQYFLKPAYQSLGGVNTGTATWRTIPDIGMQVGGCPGGIAIVSNNPNAPCNGGNNPNNGSGNSDRSFVWTYIGTGMVAPPNNIGGFIGTSVASPEFASVVALAIERNGGVGLGNINGTLIYPSAAHLGSLHRAGTSGVIPGFNGLTDANVSNNYSIMTGIGTPNVAKFIGAPAATPLAGDPKTLSNP